MHAVILRIREELEACADEKNRADAQRVPRKRQGLMELKLAGCMK
jgi:hypothetical protein